MNGKLPKNLKVSFPIFTALIKFLKYSFVPSTFQTKKRSRGNFTEGIRKDYLKKYLALPDSLKRL